MAEQVEPPAKQNFCVDSNHNMIEWNQLINALKVFVGKMPDTTITMLTIHAVFLPSYNNLKLWLNKVVSIYKTIIRYGWRTAEAIEVGVREKDTDKLNFNPTKILEKSSPLVINPWFTETTILSHYKFSMKFNIPIATPWIT